MLERKHFGQAGELLVEKFLQDRGFSIVVRNFNCRYGEIDLIAKKNDLISFVEVKTRKKAYFPISSVVNFSKQKKIIKTAKYYIAKFEPTDKTYRFDVASVLIDDQDFEINYIENAFYGS